MKITDLKPCPFCGGSNICPSSWDIQCYDCKATLPGEFHLAAPVWNRRAALAVQTQQGVEVKKLEWVKHPSAELWRAYTTLGVYQVHAFKIPGWTFDKHDGGGTSASADDIEAAKAAAYADHKERVLALVDVPAVESEPVAIYHGNGLIDCGDAGHHNIELLKLIPSGTELYAHPPRSLSNEGSETEHVLRLAENEIVELYKAIAPRGNFADRSVALSAIRLALSTRKGSSEGDGSATITIGGDHD